MIFYLINCSFVHVMQSSGVGHDEFFFYFENMLVDIGMLTSSCLLLPSLYSDELAMSSALQVTLCSLS
jgi:hypothetical protein